MALRQRRNDRMRREFLNYYFVVMSALLYPILFATSSPCGYPEDYPFTHGNAYKAITCSTTNLPTVTDGSFDCAPNTEVPMDEACALSCNGGFYAAYSNQAVCEEGTSHQEGKWSEGSFVCRAITCQEVHLPTANAGFFNCSGFYVGDKCNLTCEDGYYPYATKYIVCEEYDDHQVNWTVGEFQCSAVTCQNVDLPTVNAGFFKCSGYSVGDQCNLTCNDGYYPSSPNETICERNVHPKANWTVGNFQCSAITCSTTNLPTVTEVSFDCAHKSDVPKGEACTVICSDGFYPPYSNKTVCEAGTTIQGGVWSNGSFVCRAITCSTTNLPIVTNGAFKCDPNTDMPKDETCTLRCNHDDFYPAYSRQAVCEAGISNQGGAWSNGPVVCQRLECYEWNAWNGTKYKLTSTKQAWEESRKLCESDTSHLVAIENKEEDEFVHNMVKHCFDLGDTSSWSARLVSIGLNDLTTEGTWEWIDGTVSTYRNWYEEEPNIEQENCGFIDRNTGQWFDWACQKEVYAVCEKDNPHK